MKKSIIVCDDQEIFREMVASYLERKGYVVERAADAAECLRMAAKVNPEAIILDVKLPGADGLAVLKKLRELGLKSRVILMSGRPLEDDQWQVLEEYDAKAILTKPFKLNDILTSLESRGPTMARHILVVDDEGRLREMLSNYLEKSGYIMTTAKNGKECLEKASATKFDAIFMDVRMPDLDGLEAVQKLREMGNSSPVVLMTAFSDVNSYDDAIKYGANGFLRKPFRVQDARQWLQQNENKKYDVV